MFIVFLSASQPWFFFVDSRSKWPRDDGGVKKQLDFALQNMVSLRGGLFNLDKLQLIFEFET